MDGWVFFFDDQTQFCTSGVTVLGGLDERASACLEAAERRLNASYRFIELPKWYAPTLASRDEPAAPLKA